MNPNDPNPEELERADQAWQEVAGAAGTTPGTDEPTPARGGNFFTRFLRENWPWIVFPALIAILLVVIAFIIIALGSDGNTRPFVYAN